MNAPCGHPGIPIIGTYVKCAVGCDGPVPPRHRGEPGHVVGCACRPCQLRRRVTTIVLRTRDGRDARRMPWDGITDVLKFTAAEFAAIRHILFVDADGKVILRVDCDHDVLPDAEVKLAINVHGSARDAALLTVDRGPTVPELLQQIGVWGPSPLAGLPALLDQFTKRLAAACAIPVTLLLGVDPGYDDSTNLALFYRGCTRTQLAVMAKSVPGVHEVEVKEPQPGDVRIIITEGSDEVDWRWERRVREAVECVRPAGIALDVFVETPQERLRRVGRAVERAVFARVPARDYDALAVDLAHEMLCEQFGECVAQEATVNVRVLFGGSRLHITVPTRGRFYCIMVPLPEYDRLGTWVTSAKAGELARVRLDALALTAGVVTPEEIAASRWSELPATTEHPPKK